MKSTDHLHQQIARATSRLAQLQAQELIIQQRKAVRARAEARRARDQRKRRLAELIGQAGAQNLSDDEILRILALHANSRGQDREQDTAMNIEPTLRRDRMTIDSEFGGA